jgi:hypothetical protein
MMKDLGISDASSLSMMDAVVYLLSRDALELTKKTDVKFTFVSPKNPYYAYWRTAYAKHLIGTSANPSTKISCDTFFVFQGMLQGWDVSYTPATVKSALWKEAETRGILHGCVRGALMKGQNL